VVKGIESYGIPIVHLSTIITISKSVGANRIVPTIAIPHPLGKPDLNPKDEKKLRRSIVEKALELITTKISEQTILE